VALATELLLATEHRLSTVDSNRPARGGHCRGYRPVAFLSVFVGPECHVYASTSVRGRLSTQVTGCLAIE
jgi:hypothetical protein